MRDRRLAGAGRAGAWARGEVRRRQLAFVRRNWLRLTIMLLAATCLIALASTLVPGGFWRGLVIGALGASALAAMFVLVLESTGTAPRAMGATAEEWTAGELRKLRRQGWTLVNHFGLGYGDIDHIVIGRAAIFVVETKWSASGWGRPNTTLEDTVAQVTKAARSVRLWTRAESLGLPVVPVVFLWGGADGHTLPVSERFDTTVSG